LQTAKTPMFVASEVRS